MPGSSDILSKERAMDLSDPERDNFLSGDSSICCSYVTSVPAAAVTVTVAVADLFHCRYSGAEAE
jgi:hypothetical protein